MATSVKTGCQVNLDPNVTGKTVVTFLTGQVGIKITSLKLENDTGASTYLTPNGTGRTFYIKIRGMNGSTVNQDVTFRSFTITSDGPSITNALGNNGVIDNPSANTVFTGSIELYVSINQGVGSTTGFIGNVKATLTYENYQTNCTAPTSVSVSRSRSVCTVSWSGASGGTNNPITSYGVLVNTTASASGATTVNSGINATSLTSQPNGTAPTSSKTYYFGVRAQSSYNNSDYKWSGAITVPAKPSVSAGDVITKTQMDNLKTWINGSQTTVTKYDTIKASVGNTYKSGLTAYSTVIDDTWYNNAASGT